MPPPVEIAIVLPADARFVALARVAAAGLAVELDFSVDQIEELRVGVDELVTMLIEVAAEGASIDLCYRLFDSSIEVEGHTPSDGDLNERLDAISRQILDSVVDRCELGPGTGTIEKRREPT